jgi:hypothetical protein
MGWLDPLLVLVYAFTLVPFVAVCVLAYQGLRRGLGVAALATHPRGAQVGSAAR